MTSSLAQQVELVYRRAPCVFLDCDGVIFDSNGFKLDALRHALAGYPKAAVASMERFWSENGGMSRYRKLEHFFRDILAVPDVPARVREAAARFGEFSRKAYAFVDPIPEALRLAEDAGRERCFVVSGTDQTELQEVFEEKGLSPLFARVCGSPTTKLDHVSHILEERGCPPHAALFIGDGGGDFDVCHTLGVPFIYLDQYSEWTTALTVLEGAPATLRMNTWSELLTTLGVSALSVS